MAGNPAANIVEVAGARFLVNFESRAENYRLNRLRNSPLGTSIWMAFPEFEFGKGFPEKRVLESLNVPKTDLYKYPLRLARQPKPLGRRAWRRFGERLAFIFYKNREKHTQEHFSYGQSECY
jgi:hypothetical protein